MGRSSLHQLPPLRRLPAFRLPPRGGAPGAPTAPRLLPVLLAAVLGGACGGRSELDDGLGGGGNGGAAGQDGGGAGTDGGGDAGAGPAAPRPLRPWNGENTGSPWHVDNLRPTFRWAAVPGATRYELEVDDSCTAPNGKDCAFTSPEIAQRSLSAPTFRPGEGLPVPANMLPVGRRYFWHVRACSGACGAYSAVRYVNVGRQAGDVDGDGYADVIGSAVVPVAQGVGTVASPQYQLFRGGPMPDGKALPFTLEGPVSNDPMPVALVGDVNGDGFGDVLAWQATMSGGFSIGGRLALFFGGASGPADMPAVVLTGTPAGVPNASFGQTFAGAGDLDGDGYDDLVVGSGNSNADGMRSGRVTVYRGGPTVSDTPSLTLHGMPNDGLGAQVGGGGDVDGDGYDDLVVGRPATRSMAGGDALVFRGGATLDGGVDFILHLDGVGAFPFGVAIVGDVDGDDLADVAALGVDDARSPDPRGTLALFRGAALMTGKPDARLAGTDPGQYGGGVRSACDLDGDGRRDIVSVWSRRNGMPGPRATVVRWNGAADLVAGPDFFGETTETDTAVGVPGDVDGDGVCDVLVGNHKHDEGGERRGQILVYRGGGDPAMAWVSLAGANALDRLGWSVGGAASP